MNNKILYERKQLISPIMSTMTSVRDVKDVSTSNRNNSAVSVLSENIIDIFFEHGRGVPIAVQEQIDTHARLVA